MEVFKGNDLAQIIGGKYAEFLLNRPPVTYLDRELDKLDIPKTFRERMERLIYLKIAKRLQETYALQEGDDVLADMAESVIDDMIYELSYHVENRAYKMSVKG